MSFPSWFHLAAALYSAGVPEPEAQEIAYKAFTQDRPMLWLRKVYDDYKDADGKRAHVTEAIGKVISANVTPDDAAALGFIRSEVARGRTS